MLSFWKMWLVWCTGKNHFEDVLRFRGFFDLAFWFIVEIWHDVHNRSGSYLSSISCQEFSVSPDCSDLVNLRPHLWCNISKETLFLGIWFCVFDFYFVLIKNSCFLCALCGNITAFCLLSLKITMQNPLWKMQVCPKFIYIIIDNNWLHKSGANSTFIQCSYEVFFIILTHFYVDFSCLFYCDKMSIWNFDIFICFHKQARYKNLNLWCHVTSCTWV